MVTSPMAPEALNSSTATARRSISVSNRSFTPMKARSAPTAGAADGHPLHDRIWVGCQDRPILECRRLPRPLLRRCGFLVFVIANAVRRVPHRLPLPTCRETAASRPCRPDRMTSWIVPPGPSPRARRNPAPPPRSKYFVTSVTGGSDNNTASCMYPAFHGGAAEIACLGNPTAVRVVEEI